MNLKSHTQSYISFPHPLSFSFSFSPFLGSKDPDTYKTSYHIIHCISISISISSSSSKRWVASKLEMDEKWKLSKKEASSSSSSSNSFTRSFSTKSPSCSNSKSPLLRSSSVKNSSFSRSCSQKNSSSSSSITHKCSNLAKEQKTRFYIMRKCVAMLVCWHKHGDSLFDKRKHDDS